MKLRKDNILFDGLYNYAKYGKSSYFTDILSKEELENIKPKKLTDLLKGLAHYKHKINYYGQTEEAEVVRLIEKYHKTPEKIKEIPNPVKYKELEVAQNKVLFVNYDMVQTMGYMMSRDVKFDKNLQPIVTIFNEYYANSMGAITFQEIRESMGLAYSARGYYTSARQKDKYNYVAFFVATQADKLYTAFTEMTKLMNKMPVEEAYFNNCKTAIQNKIESERIQKKNIHRTYESLLEKGINYDNRKQIYELAKTAKMGDLIKFFDERVKGKKYIYLVIGNKKDVNFEELKKIGEVEELSLEEIFGY